MAYGFSTYIPIYLCIDLSYLFIYLEFAGVQRDERHLLFGGVGLRDGQRDRALQRFPFNTHDDREAEGVLPPTHGLQHSPGGQHHQSGTTQSQTWVKIKSKNSVIFIVTKIYCF